MTLSLTSRFQKAAHVFVFLCLGAVWITCIFRAVSQPITVDEADVYFRYLRHRPFFGIFDSRYNPSNHVLQTALAYGTVHLFGPSEFAIRLPSLLASPLYLWAAWRIAFLFRRLGFALLALGLMVLNPLVLDYLSLARGYGTALTLFAWSLYFSLRFLQHRNPRALIPAGILLGLSIAANLTFVIPVIGLGLIMLTGLSVSHALRYLTSVFITAIVVLARPLVTARRSDFYFGSSDALQSVTTLSNSSLFYHGNMPLFFEWTFAYVQLIWLVDVWVTPLVLAGMALVLLANFRTAPILRLTSGPLLISILLLGLGHALVGLQYPYDRTGLYLIILFPLACIAAIEVLFERDPTLRWTLAPAIAALGAVLVIYCLEFHVGDFAEWPFAADVKPYMETIRTRSPTGHVRIGGSFVFSYLINFYREEHRSNWLYSFEVPALAPGYDYYLLLPEDRRYVKHLGLRILQDSRESILAVSSTENAP